jgi:hypothetical protein
MPWCDALGVATANGAGRLASWSACPCFADSQRPAPATVAGETPADTGSAGFQPAVSPNTAGKMPALPVMPWCDALGVATANRAGKSASWSARPCSVDCQRHMPRPWRARRPLTLGAPASSRLSASAQPARCRRSQSCRGVTRWEWQLPTGPGGRQAGRHVPASLTVSVTRPQPWRARRPRSIFIPRGTEGSAN